MQSVGRRSATQRADELIRLYHERWEIESGYLALRHTLLQGRVLRSHDPAGLEQDLWALLTLYQVLRHAMVETAEARPGPILIGSGSPPPRPQPGPR
jgi:hypothetical protein